MRLASFRIVLPLCALALGWAPGIAGDLFVGANYHPHDPNPEAWARDIKLVQQDGFRVVRMGHLAWFSGRPRHPRPPGPGRD
jgi:beta-galactosidase